MATLQPLIAILGPTAVGKSELALKLAQEFRGEIVSADSRQVYRGMDIGTAKPTQKEQARIPHHLIDLVNPNENFSLSDYQRLAYETISSIHARGHVPFLVGGSGLYVRAVLEGLTIPRVQPNLKRRAELEHLAASDLYARLQALDPAAAGKISPGNARRMIRALEVIEATGDQISLLQKSSAPSYAILRLGLTLPREQLYNRINARVDDMIVRGLVEEVRTLMGSLESHAAMGEVNGGPMSGLGYRQIAMYVSGEIDLAEAIRLLKRDTRRFVHHQYSWFRLDDPRIKWFDVSIARYAEIRTVVAEFL